MITPLLAMQRKCMSFARSIFRACLSSASCLLPVSCMSLVCLLSVSLGLTSGSNNLFRASVARVLSVVSRNIKNPSLRCYLCLINSAAWGSSIHILFPFLWRHERWWLPQRLVHCGDERKAMSIFFFNGAFRVIRFWMWNYPNSKTPNANNPKP